MTFLFFGHLSIMDLLSVIHKSHFFHSLSMSIDLINLILFPRNPFFDRKNSVDDLDLPNSSRPIIVKLISGCPYINTFKLKIAVK